MIGAILAKRNIPKVVESLNKRDLDMFLEGFADDAVLIQPGDVPGVGGTHTGKSAIRAFYEYELEQFPKLRLSPKHIAIDNFLDMTGNNVVIMHWEADMTNRDGFRLLNSGVSVMTIKDRKVVHMQNFVFDTSENFRKAWGHGKPKG
jgi:ketosteroid isomerase-like protein